MDHLRHTVPHRNSDDSETDEYNVIGNDRQYERIGDRASGSSTATSRSSNNHSNIGTHPMKATHYAESAIYRRSRGYPSPVDNEPSSMPIHVPPPPQFFMNHHRPTQHTAQSAQQQQQSPHDGWKSPHSNTLEHNLKNKSHHNLISSFQNNLDTGGSIDFEPTCLMRTASGSLFIPNDGHKGLGNPLQTNDFATSGTMPLKNSADPKKNIDNCQLPSVVPVHNHFGRPLASHLAGSRFQLRKTLSSHCSWRCAAIIFMLLSLALVIAITFIMRVCPELCSGHDNCKCECSSGLKGKEGLLLTRDDECEVSDCSGHGVCVKGTCHCDPGFKSKHCDEVDCSDPNCSNHGRCVSGMCLCAKGWKGADCADIDTEAVRSYPDCSGHGNFDSQLQQCNCDERWTGPDCSQGVCPVLCSGRGQYHNGECQCGSGWKGKECQLREDECEVSDCNGHGDCMDGTCHCFPGYKSKHCEEVDCLDPDCSNHGHCVAGMCLCGKGWKGVDCAEPDSEAIRCLPDCSGHGNFDLQLQQCICDERWTGPDCSQERCDLDCGNNGHCQSGKCLCDDGWTGAKCNEKLCDQRCLEHGQCKNGTCLCIQGWNGKHCTLDGCPKTCNNHGECVQRGNEWQCECGQDWGGIDCSVPLENVCDDQKDNDNDGLIDCADPECCSRKSCEGKQLCFSALDPQDILLRKQPPAVTASFFQRMQFLIEEESVQSYAHKVAFNDSMFWNRFNDSRASVIRGHVVNHGGQGITGVRIGVATDPLLGFTLTRDTGWFDLMVNGGGAVTLHIQRDPFRPLQRVVMVPWNEIVVIDRVVLAIDERSSDNQKPSICSDHDYDNMKPTVLATWKHSFQGGCSSKSAILAESQVVQESIKIPGTDLNLVYHSSRVSGYLSTIELQLTHEKIPASLRLIHLKIAIEGILFEKTFEADPMIMFTYAWNRRNVYRQKVFGLATAMVHVGYQYLSCANVIWDVQTVQLAGHDMAISEIGGWNLDIHHRYNFHEGILQKGDGTNVYMKQKSKVMLTSMGDGQQRPLHCPYCNGIAKDQRLLAPVALASAPDGSLFVGDFNLVRRIKTDGTVQTVIELSESSVAYKYHLAVGPIDGKLYFSDPEKHQILRAMSLDDPSDPRNNLEIVVGTGVKCLPGDRSACGDGRLARDSRLSYPKGLAIAASGEIYIADGTNIRFVDAQGVIHTLIGDHYHKSHWKPLPCSGSIPLQKVALRWPTQLAISPIDNSLHLLDDHMILKLTQDRRLRVVAGRPSHCSSVITGNQDEVPNSETGESLATQVFLETPQSIAFSPNGDLYIAESDSQNINRVRVVTASDGKINRLAGADIKCSCMDIACECFSSDLLAVNAKMSTVSSIAVTPDGRVHICDQENLRIRTVLSPLPQQNLQNGEYEIVSPTTNEIYVFNRHGQHISSKSVLTGATIYTFSYNVNTLNGKLSSVTDSAGNKLYILRDYSNQVKTIENSQGGKCRLTMSRNLAMLQTFTTPDNFIIKFAYHSSGDALLSTRSDSWGRSVTYQYDQYGRLTRAIRPSGDVIDMNYKLGVDGAKVSIDQNGDELMRLKIKGSEVSSIISGDDEQPLVMKRISAKDSKFIIKSSDTSITEIESLASPVIADLWPKMAETWPMPSRVRRIANDETNQRIEWKHYVRRAAKDRQSGDKHVVTVGRKLKVNGETVLAVEYDRDAHQELLLDQSMKPIVSVSYDTFGRPLKWTSNYNLTAVSLEYDRFGRLSSWTRGQLSITMQYDMSGRLAEARHGDKSGRMYKYSDTATSPSEIIEPSGSRYLVQYDNSGGVTAIITPAGHRHEIGRQTSLGFYKLLYLPPGIKMPYILHYDDSGRVIAKLLPENSGRVVMIYNQNGLLDTQFSGKEKTELSYHDGTSLIKTVIKQFNENLDFRIDHRYHGSLIKEEKHRFGARSSFSSYKLRYKYIMGKVSEVEFELQGRGVETRKYKKNTATGALEGIDGFAIIRRNVNSLQITDERSMKTIVTDSYGRVVLITLAIWNKELFSQVIHYHEHRSRIREIRLKFGTNYLNMNYSYTTDGFIEQVVTGSVVSKFIYDIAGDVKSVWEGDTQITIRRDESGRARGFGEGSDLYTIDERGFVISRGQDRYTWNSNSDLTSVTKDDQRVVTYYYDHRKRLIARRESSGNVTQFVYDETQPQRITHCIIDGRIISFVYDTNGHLVSMSVEGTKYYVASDHLGSPIAVFNSDGILVKEIVRNVWGKVIRDSNSGFWLPIDFRGAIRDPITGLVHFIGGRVYDPLIGQWLTPNWDQIESLINSPEKLHLYRYECNDPINRESDNVEHVMWTDLTQWLPPLGIDISEILPKHDTSIETVAVISGLECQSCALSSQLQSLSITSVPQSAVRSRAENTLSRTCSLSIAQLPSQMSSVIISRALSPSSQTLVTTVDSESSPMISSVLTTVFNWTQSLRIHLPHHSQDEFFFVQPDVSRSEADFDQLQRLGSMVNVTRLEPTDHSSSHTLMTMSGNLLLNVRYGVTEEEELRRVIRMVRRKAVEEAWKREAQYVRMGYKGLANTEWTQDERQQLLATGMVDKYFGTDLHGIERYPQLADDPNNVLFKRDSQQQSRKRRNNRSRRQKQSYNIMSIVINS